MAKYSIRIPHPPAARSFSPGADDYRRVGGRTGGAGNGEALFTERGPLVGGSSICAGQRGVAVDEGAVRAAVSTDSRGDTAGGTGSTGTAR